MDTQTVDRPSEIHGKAVSLFRKGDYENAAQLFAEALLHEQSRVRWNEWATSKFLAGHATEAEGGYRKALELEPQNIQAQSRTFCRISGG